MMKYTIGIDEVGRGPIAGPLTFCALQSKSGYSFRMFRGSKDSKKLSLEKREKWFQKIQKEKKNGSLDFALAHISPRVLDSQGLSLSIKKAIERCLKKLKARPEECLVLLDGGIRAPDIFRNQRTIIKGDERLKIIGLASIIAKVTRDRMMVKLAKKYPKYGFEQHKGYGTKEHYRALKTHGMCEIHRRSFLRK